jgi:hypothetical protein
MIKFSAGCNTDRRRIPPRRRPARQTGAGAEKSPDLETGLPAINPEAAWCPCE